MTDEPILTTEQSAVPGERSIDQTELRPGGTISRQWAETEWSGDGQIKVGRKENSRCFAMSRPASAGRTAIPSR
jgi:hypothetical protein